MLGTQSDLADFLGISTRRVRELEASGVMPGAGPDGRDIRAAVRCYCDHLREIAAGRATDRGELDLIQERARLAKEQADRVALQNARARRELIPVADVAAVVREEYQVVRQGLLAIPARTAAELAAETDASRVERTLKDAIADVLEELSTPDETAAEAAERSKT